jgi:hypothetical protein
MRGRALLRKIKWEVGLLLIVLIIAMLPSVTLFRWSFRWLPFLHVILALCAAEALRILGSRKDGSAEGDTKGAEEGRFSAFVTPGLFGFALVGLALVASWAFQTLGAHAFPFVWITLGIAAAWAILEKTGLRKWAAVVTTFASLLATYVCIPPNCGVPKYNLPQELTKPAPLEPERLYLSVYPAPEFAYRGETKPDSFGAILRPGSTSLWGGVHLLNGYSPIRPSGVAREFGFATHGEIRPDVGELLLEQESGAEGILARLGVDGIIVANEMGWVPQPEAEWELAVATEEGRVFHRRNGMLARVRSVTAIDSRPNEQFAPAAVSRIVNGRNRLQADVTVPENGPSAMLTISRPFFSGYRGKIGDVSLKVDSYRGLMPIVEIPAGTNGRLTLVYRPWWLVYGGVISVACLAFGMVAALRAWSARSAAS